MAAGGMGRAADLRRGPLSARRRGAAPADLPSSHDDDGDGRPCWVLLQPGQRPGLVHTWRKSPSGEGWEALLVAWVPAEAVRPR